MVYLDLSEVEEKDIDLVDSYPNRPKLQRCEALQIKSGTAQ